MASVKKEARLLKTKAVDALILAVEAFNRPDDRGRADRVLRDLSHAFEMLMKAALVERGGRIRERPSAAQTISFDACVRQGLSNAAVKFLVEEQALTIQMLNALRDAAEHHLLSISEQQLYVQAQAALTLFADVLADVFGEHLAEHLPERVLPLSTNPPRDLAVMVADEVELIRSLVAPGTRRRVEGRARAKPLAIMDAAIAGEFVQPSDGELEKLLNRIGAGEEWHEILPGVASLQLDIGGGGIPYSLRITKKEGVPIHLVADGTPGAAVVAIRKVDKLGFYTTGMRKLAKKLSMSEPLTGAIVAELHLRNDSECYDEFSIDSQHYKRFSDVAHVRIVEALPSLDLDDVWERRRPRRRT